MMPYELYRQMPDEDLASIVVHLRTLKPVKRLLPKTEMPFPLSRLVNTAPVPVTDPVLEPDVSTPEKRGQYPVMLAACTECHSPRDGQGQLMPGLGFAGRSVFENQIGRVVSTNITPDPSGIPYYTEELSSRGCVRQVKARKLHNQMPWVIYRNMTDDDLKAIFAFLKTIPAARHRVDNSKTPTDCPVCLQRHRAGEENTK